MTPRRSDQYEQILAEQGAARARAKTADVRAAVAGLEAVLTDRSRNLGRRSIARSSASSSRTISRRRIPTGSVGRIRRNAAAILAAVSPYAAPPGSR